MDFKPPLSFWFDATHHLGQTRANDWSLVPNVRFLQWAIFVSGLPIGHTKTLTELNYNLWLTLSYPASSPFYLSEVLAIQKLLALLSPSQHLLPSGHNENTYFLQLA